MTLSLLWWPVLDVASDLSCLCSTIACRTAPATLMVAHTTASLLLDRPTCSHGQESQHHNGIKGQAHMPALYRDIMHTARNTIDSSCCSMLIWFGPVLPFDLTCKACSPFAFTWNSRSALLSVVR
jgi:hypothetical protein